MKDFDLKELEKNLAHLPQRALEHNWRTNRDWTKAVKEALHSAGVSRGLATCCSGLTISHYSEWLYDIVWLRVEPGPRNTVVVTDSPLIAECEWGNVGDIRDDFQKLLLGRADVRIMIFEANHQAGAVAIVGQLLGQVRAYARSVPGDRYLFAGYQRDKRQFYYHEYVHA